MQLNAGALALLLFAAAETPAPTPAATPTPTPRTSTAAPRTLQDVARERKLGSKGKGSLGTITLGPSTSSPAPAATPPAEAPTAPAPLATPEPELAVSTASVRVTAASNDGVVDPSGAVRVNGTIKNGGHKPACNVVIAVRINDSRGYYLASGQATPDVGVIPPGETVSFHTLVQAPPGVRGARLQPDRKDVSEGSTTMAGDWKLLGGTEASIANASEDCVK